MSDGKITIDVLLNDDDLKKGLDDISSTLKGLGGLSGSFGKMSKYASTFSKTWTALKGVIGSTAAKVVAGVGTMVVAYQQLYDASKQNFTENLSKLGSMLGTIVDVFKSVASEVVSFLSTVGDVPTSLQDCLTGFAEYNSVMQEVKAISGATEEQFSSMLKVTQDLGRTTQFTSAEAASGLKMMSMAGWSASESIVALDDVLRLAQIGATDLGTTSDIVTDVIEAMGMSATDCGDMVDMMTATITNSNTNVEMLGNTMQYAAAIAGTLGVEFADLAVATGLLGNAGIKASKAGTALRTMLTTLSGGGTDKANAAMEKYGISMQQTADGAMDLQATLVNLRSSLKDLPLAEKVSVVKTIFGKTAMAGALSIINASEESFNQLTESVEGSTTSMTYWRNECEKAGMSEENTTKKLDSLHKVFTETKDMADALNLSSDDLTKTISLLGDDGKVTSKNVENLFTTFDKLNNATKDQKAIMSKYGIEVTKLDSGAIDYNTTLKSLVNSLRDKSKAEREAILTQLGLSQSINEINELCEMTPERFDEIIKGIEATQSAAEKAQGIIDESFTGAVKRMGSALNGASIILISQFAPAMGAVCDWVSDVVNAFSEKGGGLHLAIKRFNEGITSAIDVVRNADLTGAMTKMFEGINTFINSGAIDNILNLGGEIVHQISQGIIKNKDNITEGISSVIEKVCGWITKYGPEIKEAGLTIIQALRDGIDENATLIHGALDVLADVMNSWIDSSAQLNAMAGKFADVFINSLIENTASAIGGKVTEFWNSITSTLFNGTPDMSKGGTGAIAGIWTKISDWLFGESYAAETSGSKKPTSNKNNKNTTSLSNKFMSMDTSEIKAYEAELNKLQSTIQNVSTSISSSFTTMQNAMRSSLVGCTNIIRNQFVNMTNSIRTQSLSMSNIIRNQFISISNVVRNQITNARNSFTTQMMSMSAVARNQASNVRNTVTTQMISMRKVVATQSASARNSFTSQMMSMVAVARNQSRAVGQALGQGLASGIRAYSSQAVSEARSLVNKVTSIMNSTAKINSPSKVTMKTGSGLAEGLEVGISKRMPKTLSLAASKVTSLTDQMKAVVDYEIAKVSVNTSTTSNSRVMTTNKNETRLNNEDVERLASAISSRQTVVQTTIGKKVLIDAVATPINEYLNKKNNRQARLEGR